MRALLIIAFLLIGSVSGADSFSLEDLKSESTLSKLADANSLGLMAVGAVSVLSVHNSLDEQIQNNWKDHQQMSRPISETGNFLGSGVATALIIGSQYYWDDNRNHWKSHARTFFWEVGFVEILKIVNARTRPDLSDTRSFPSGHTATAFATATALSYAYGWKAAALAYPLAALVATSRIADNKHWASDVVGGAFIGTLVARASFVETDSNSKTHWLPALDSESISLNFISIF